jgi:hypothetical protein
MAIACLASRYDMTVPEGQRTSIAPQEGTTAWTGGCGETFKMSGEKTRGAWSVVKQSGSSEIADLFTRLLPQVRG